MRTNRARAMPRATHVPTAIAQLTGLRSADRNVCGSTAASQGNAAMTWTRHQKVPHKTEVRNGFIWEIENPCVAVLPKKGVWNFQALKSPACIETGEFQTPFLGKAMRGKLVTNTKALEVFGRH